MSAAPSPRIIILETSGRVGQVAVAEGARLLAQRRLDETRRHARDLAPALCDLLAAQGWPPRSVELVIVSRGPGSYTGLRVGIMSAKAFAYAAGCALVAVETFAAIALQAPPEATEIDVFADAQQDRVYVQKYARAAGRWQARSALRIRPFADWLADPAKAPWVTGAGLRGKRERLPEDVRATDEALWDPRPESLLQLGWERYRAGQRDDVWAVEPLYLRPSAAEEQWASRPSPEKGE